MMIDYPTIPQTRECAIINSIAMIASCREQLFENMTEDDFGYAPARDAFSFQKKAWDAKVSLDNYGVIQQFMQDYSEVLAMADATHHGIAMNEVIESATRRRVWDKMLTLQDQLGRNDVSMMNVVDTSVDINEYLHMRTAANNGVRSITEILKSQVDMVQRANQEDSPIIPFGIETMEQWNLLRPGTMTLMAGRPGSGKTAVMCTAMNKQAELGLKPACYCAEMTEEEITIRMAAQFCNIPFFKIISGMKDASKGQWAAYSDAHQKIIEGKPYLKCGCRMNIREFEMFATRAVHEHGSRVIWLDYVQKLIPMNPKMDIRLHIAECSGRIKELSQKLKTPIIPLAQFNREAEDKMPQVSHLKEAGALEEDADGIILLDRPYARPEPSPRKYNVFRDDTPEGGWRKVEMAQLINKIILIVGKNRNGPCGTNFCDFDGPMMNLKEATWSW